MKKFSSILILMSSILILSSCGAASPSSKETAGTVETQNTTPTEKTTEKAEVQTETAKSDPITIQIFSGYESAAEKEVSKYAVAQMEEALNIKLDRLEVPSSVYAEKLQLSLASGKYADAYLFNSHNDALLRSSVENGLFIPLNSYIENAPNIMKYTYKEAFDAGKTLNDDNIYLIPRTSIARNDGFGVRQDWLDKIGFKFTSNDLSVTQDEFKDILKGFTEGDPDGNGKKDTFGTLYQPTDEGNLNPIGAGAFNVLGWQESTDQYKYIDASLEVGNQNYKDLLQFNQDIYKSGYIHPDSPLLKGLDSVNNLLYNGEVGMVGIFGGHVSNRDMEVKKNNPNGTITYLSGITNKDGKLQGVTLTPGIWGGVAITKDSKNPKAVVDMIDFFLSDEGWESIMYGEPGFTYNKADDGKITLIKEPYIEQRLKGWSAAIARRNNDPDYFLDLSLPQSELDITRNWIKISMDTVVFDKLYGKVPAIATDAAFTEANNKRKETITKIIMGDLSVEEYDKALTKWLENGGSTYIEQCNEIIENMQK